MAGTIERTNSATAASKRAGGRVIEEAPFRRAKSTKIARSEPRKGNSLPLVECGGTVRHAADLAMVVAHMKEIQTSPHIHNLNLAEGMPVHIKVPGLSFSNVQKLIEALNAGLSWPQLAGFLKKSGFNLVQLAEFLGIPERTLARRREKGLLTENESERFARLVEIFNACLELFDGSEESVREWLTTPAYGLNNVRPIDFAKSEFGAREVRNLIGRLQNGVFS